MAFATAKQKDQTFLSVYVISLLGFNNWGTSNLFHFTHRGIEFDQNVVRASVVAHRDSIEL
jgi:hypothetical protein